MAGYDKCSVLGRFAQADTIVPDPGNPLDWDRYSYAGNNPILYIDPNGHHYCDSKYAVASECIGYDPDYKKDTDIILNLSFSLWLDSTHGIHSNEAMEWMSWVVINRYDDYISGGGYIKAPYISLYYKFKDDQNEIIETNAESFDRVNKLLTSVYNRYLMGEEDPTKGSIFYVHVNSINTGVTYENINVARTEIQKRNEIMASSYSQTEATQEAQPYPFIYRLSSPYYVEYFDQTSIGKGIIDGWYFLYVGNNKCVYTTSCGW
jgi:hypothetical protein